MDHHAIWNETHTNLQQSMKKEIETMREILGNMHEEEITLISKDMVAKAHVMEERAKLIQRLTSLRNARLEATQKLESLAFPHGVPKEIPLEKLLPSEDAATCETLMLRDQMMALIERMNLQSNRNELLTDISKRQGSSAPALQPQLEKKKNKISLATLPPKE